MVDRRVHQYGAPLAHALPERSQLREAEHQVITPRRRGPVARERGADCREGAQRGVDLTSLAPGLILGLPDTFPRPCCAVLKVITVLCGYRIDRRAQSRKGVKIPAALPDGRRERGERLKNDGVVRIGRATQHVNLAALDPRAPRIDVRQRD